MPPHLVHGEDLKAPEFTEDTLEWVRKYWLKKPDYVFFKHPEISAVAGQCLFVGLYEMPRRKEDDACSNWSEDTDNMHCPGDERSIAYNKAIDRMTDAGFPDISERYGTPLAGGFGDELVLVDEEFKKANKKWHRHADKHKKYRPSKKCLKHAGHRVFEEEAAKDTADFHERGFNRQLGKETARHVDDLNKPLDFSYNDEDDSEPIDPSYSCYGNNVTKRAKPYRAYYDAHVPERFRPYRSCYDEDVSGSTQRYRSCYDGMDFSKPKVSEDHDLRLRRHKSPSSVAAQTINAYGSVFGLDGAADSLLPLSTTNLHTANAANGGNTNGNQTNQGQTAIGKWFQPTPTRPSALEHSQEQVHRFFKSIRGEEEQSIARYRAENPF